MPIFANPKSAALNPDRLAKKKVYERDVARVRSGVPSASSKTDTETFGSLMDTLEDLKIELIKISENVSSGIIADKNLSYGSLLNKILKASKIIKKIQSKSVTNTEINKLQEITTEINEMVTSFDTNYQYIKFTYENDRNIATEGQNKIREKIISFYKTLLDQLQPLINLLNTKITTSSIDSNSKIAPEHSGINAPPEPPDASLQGSGFRTSWKLEKGASQYQNQRYV